jgi:uncharacterized membrane protein YGL010W
MKKVDSRLSDYAFYHRSRGNKVCHFIGIPLIIYSLFLLLRSFPLAESITAAELLLLLSFFYYLTLDLRLALAMLVLSVLLDLAAWKTADFRIGIVAFLIGWIFQGIGHAVYEKRSPAFLRNLVHLLVGPIFLLNEIWHVRPITPATA